MRVLLAFGGGTGVDLGHLGGCTSALLVAAGHGVPCAAGVLLLDAADSEARTQDSTPLLFYFPSGSVRGAMNLHPANLHQDRVRPSPECER